MRIKDFLVTALLSAAVAGCATATVREARVVSGRVTDEAGRAVANSPVVVVARQLDLTIRLSYVEVSRQELKTTTDAQGRFRLEFVPERLGNNFFLFFYGDGFDGVQYRRPESLDVTQRLDREREVRIDQVLRFHPDWPEVQRLLLEVGADSERGRILRRLGLPEKREVFRAAGEETETWWYYAKGVSYKFAGGALAGTYQFEPIIGARPMSP